MKTATKVFLILSIVGGIISFIVMLVYGIQYMNLDIEDIYSLYESNISEADAEVMLETFNVLGIYYIIEGVLALVPAILGGVVLWKVWTAKTNPGIGWSIITLLFVNLIAGILMLCTKEQDNNRDFVPQYGYYGGPYNGPFNDP